MNSVRLRYFPSRVVSLLLCAYAMASFAWLSQAAAQTEANLSVLQKKCVKRGAAGAEPECVARCPWDIDPVKDDDFASNCYEIAKNDLKVETIKFQEGNLSWHLQKITNPAMPDGPLWFAPHDDENVAFDTAIYGLLKYGGVFIAVETGGGRCNPRQPNPHSSCPPDAQDPNRNFQFKDMHEKCPDQRALSPVYTGHVLESWNPIYPIIALHSNRPHGCISVKRYGRSDCKMRGSSDLFAGKEPTDKNLKSLFAPDDTLVFLSSASRSDARTQTFKDGLNSNGVNVIWEFVDTHNNDCSLSNFAALAGIGNYFNVEVADSNDRKSKSAKAQRSIVDIIMGLPGLRNDDQAAQAITRAIRVP